MFLSKITPNPHNTQARRDICNPYYLHRTIMCAFPTPLPKNERVLFRVEKDKYGQVVSILVQSRNKPDWSGLYKNKPSFFLGPPVNKDISNLVINPNTIYRFKLRANPVKRTMVKNEKGESKKRVGLYKDRDRLEWLERKGKLCGFEIQRQNILIKPYPRRIFFIKQDEKTHKATLNIVDFEGILLVVNAEMFLKHLRAGIGPAKGLGCGLLTIAPA